MLLVAVLPICKLLMENRKNNSGAYGMFISAMLIYGTIGIFRKWIPLSSGMLAFSRGLIGGIFLLLWTLPRGKSLRLHISRKRFALLCFTGVAMGANWILLFEAYNYTTVPVATLCYYMQPTFLVLLSPVLFKEKLTLKKGLCAAVSLFGMVLVSGVVEGSAIKSRDAIGILCGLGAAVLYTTVVILNKKNPVENAEGKTVVQLFSSTVVMIPYLLLTEKPGTYTFGWPALALVLVVGIVHTGIAYAMYFGSLQRLPAQTTAVLSYIDPVVAVLLAWPILGETMSPTEIVGAVLILGAALTSEMRKKE